jgi:hypothetical protein
MRVLTTCYYSINMFYTTMYFASHLTYYFLKLSPNYHYQLHNIEQVQKIQVDIISSFIFQTCKSNNKKAGHM